MTKAPTPVRDIPGYDPQANADRIRARFGRISRKAFASSHQAGLSARIAAVIWVPIAFAGAFMLGILLGY